MSDKFSEMMNALERMVKQKARVEKNMSIAQKKMEIALLEGNDEVIEKARIDMSATFEASLDLAIEMHRQARLLQNKLGRPSF